MPCRCSCPASSPVKPMYMAGSPPERVTPPPEVLKKGWSGSMASTTSSTLMRRPTTESAPDGHSCTHCQQRVQARRSTKQGFFRDMALSGQASTQVSHPMQSFWSYDSSCTGSLLSGLWHHAHERGHPLKNTTVRIPGPSSKEFPLISSMSGELECSSDIMFPRKCKFMPESPPP